MQPIGKSKKKQIKDTCIILFCLSVIILGAVCCGRVGVGVAYQPFALSSGQCQGNNAAPVTGEQTVALVAYSGPNITICILRASDGILLRHYDLAIHGNVVGYGAGLLYIDESEEQGANSIGLCAVHISNGVEAWCQTQLNDTSRITVDPNGNNIYAVSYASGLVTAVSAHDGQILWKFSAQADTTISNVPLLAIGQGSVYVTTYPDGQNGSPTPTTSTTDGHGQIFGVNNVCALRSNNGQQLWCYAFTQQSITGLATDGNTIYVQTSNYFVFALNATNGIARWQVPITIEAAPGKLSSLIVAHGVVFSNANDGYNSDQLFALRTSDGKQLWRIPYSKQVGFMTTTDELLYVISKTGDLQVFNRLDGTPAWSLSNPLEEGATKDRNPGASLAAGNAVSYILLGSNNPLNSDLRLLAVQANNGRTLWTDQACAATSTPTPVGNNSARSCYWMSSNGYSQLNVQLFLVNN